MIGVLLSRPAVNHWSTAGSVANHRHLAQAYACEIHTQALATAIITSGINALRRSYNGVTATVLKPYLDTSQSYAAHIKHALLDTIDGVDDLYAITEFQDKFSDGRAVWDNYSGDVESIGIARAAALYQCLLEEVWRDCCRSARCALDELETLLGSELPPLYLQNHKVLAALLGGAASGLSPCFDEYRQLYAPPLPQQRRWPRRAVLQDCRVLIDGVSVDGFVRDASAGGLGLDRLPPLKRGQLITVTMESGRSFHGVIAWFSNQSAGLKFAEALQVNDPLLWG
jgi:PilZ domain